MSTHSLIFHSVAFNFPSPWVCGSFSDSLPENSIKSMILSLYPKRHCNLLLCPATPVPLSLCVSVSVRWIIALGKPAAMSWGYASSPWRAHMVQNGGLQPTDSKELKPLATKTWVSLEGDSTVCQAWNDFSPCCNFDSTLLRDPEPLTVVTESPRLPNQLPSFSAYPVWPLGYETMLNEYVIVCTLTEWNFLRKVTVLKFHTNVNVCLKSLFWWEMGMNSQSHNHSETYFFPPKELSHAW